MIETATGGHGPVFGIRFPPCEEPESTGRLAREAEEGGFEWIWAVDSPLLGGALYDPYVDLVTVAQNTERVMMGPAVTPILLRNPVATAAAILSLDRISGGRAVLGLGSGGSARVTMGHTRLGDRPHASGARERQETLREEILFYRKLFSGEPVSLGMREIRLDEVRPVKIYVAATGPKMLELAGEIADGVLIHVGIWRPVVEDAIARIRRGAERAGRDPAKIDIGANVVTAISPDGDRKKDVRRVKPEASFLYTILPHALEQAGFDTSRRVPEKMPYPDMIHAYDWDEAMAAADTYIPDGVSETFCLVGPPDAAVERIRELHALGVNQIYIRGTSSYRLPYELVRTFAEHIIPKFRQEPVRLPSGDREG